jgi:protoporphyrin/coproporphyrin ferrochelatase
MEEKSSSVSGTAKAVLLLNLGGPDSIDAVKPFLFNLFSDREIIRLGPPFMQKPLARIIAAARSGKTAGMYRRIGGKSPIGEMTQAQGAALEAALNEGASDGRRCRVYIGMRYWHPFIEDTVRRIIGDGFREIIALSLYPQYSAATSGSSFSQLEKALAGSGVKAVSIPSWHDNPSYIESLADVIRNGVASFGPAADVDVLFSAHSLPQKMIDDGDPYVDQTIATISEVVKIVPVRWHLSFQSKSGPVKWLEPSTEEKLQELAGGGVKNVLIVPVSFVSDHIETLYEIDILYKEMADKMGLQVKRSESLNTRPLFIKALKDIIVGSVTRLSP